MVLLFDGTCGICTRTARWVRRHDRAGRVLVVPNQRRGVLTRYGVSRQEADRAAWAIEQTGRRFEGAAAVNRVLQELGGGWAALAKPYTFRPLAVVEDIAYRWFASNRSRFHQLGVRPECEEAGSNCG
jgi:predicted DCC family thiol-disulfide oxidoreductase YuxK